MFEKIVTYGLTGALVLFGAKKTADIGEDTGLYKTAYSKAYELIKKREGVRTAAYYDSESVLTVGIGHKVEPSDKIVYNQTVSMDWINQTFEKDMQKFFTAAKAQMKELGINNADFLAVLTSVNFQLGTGWKNKFANTWNALKRGDYIDAINRLDQSLWARQTPVRVSDFKNAIKDVFA